MVNDDNKVTFSYQFTFKDGEKKEFYIELDDMHLNLIQEEQGSYPEWTELNNHKCPNCSLDYQECKYCPIAVNLIYLIASFKNKASYEEVDVIVKDRSREYRAHIPLQRGLSSLIGIYMVTGGCPIMEKLKPMVRYHLPFAYKDETIYRVLSMYLLAQYFLYKKDRSPDWGLKELSGIYKDIRTLNRAMCDRLRSSNIDDASINAVIILDVFADEVDFSVEEDAMGKIENLFSAYLK
jgi:hypothetical protein